MSEFTQNSYRIIDLAPGVYKLKTLIFGEDLETFSLILYAEVYPEYKWMITHTIIEEDDELLDLQDCADIVLDAFQDEGTYEILEYKDFDDR